MEGLTISCSAKSGHLPPRLISQAGIWQYRAMKFCKNLANNENPKKLHPSYYTSRNDYLFNRLFNLNVMTNDSYIVERWHELAHERNEDAQTTECPTCKGEGMEWYSNCCGAEVEKMTCTDCGEPCVYASEICGECKGEGTI